MHFGTCSTCFSRRDHELKKREGKGDEEGRIERQGGNGGDRLRLYPPRSEEVIFCSVFKIIE